MPDQSSNEAKHF